MVLVVALRSEKLYACERCGAIYDTLQLAEECEAACASGACDLEITSRAVGWIRRRLGRLRS